MVIEQQIIESSDIIASFFLGSAIAAIIFSIFLIGLLIIAAIYIYFALAWQTIAKKLNFKRYWLSWIPIASWAMILHLGKFHWAWIFLILIPIFGWIALFVLLIIAHWRIFQKLKYPGWFSLSLIIPKIGLLLYGIAVGFVAWQRKKSIKELKSKVKKKKR